MMSCALLLPEDGKVILFSNNGSLYVVKNRTYTSLLKVLLEQIKTIMSK